MTPKDERRHVKMTETERYKMALFMLIRRDLSTTPGLDCVIRSQEQLSRKSRELMEHVIKTTDYSEAEWAYRIGQTQKGECAHERVKDRAGISGTDEAGRRQSVQTHQPGE